MYGWRGRIGLLVPSINTTMETEFWRIAPEGVSVHSARIAGGRHGTPEELRGMENASKQAAQEVAMVEPDVVVYGCTSGSFFEGPAWNRKISEQLTAITRAPTVTTAGAMAACLLAGGQARDGAIPSPGLTELLSIVRRGSPDRAADVAVQQLDEEKDRWGTLQLEVSVLIVSF
jgi:maleate cis-trans isomerase